MASTNVDFPAPELPTSATHEPPGMSRSTALSASIAP
jgi:hypothetical protein